MRAQYTLVGPRNASNPSQNRIAPAEHEARIYDILRARYLPLLGCMEAAPTLVVWLTPYDSTKVPSSKQEAHGTN